MTTTGKVTWALNAYVESGIRHAWLPHTNLDSLSLCGQIVPNYKLEPDIRYALKMCKICSKKHGDPPWLLKEVEATVESFRRTK